MAEHWQALVANLAVVALFISAWVHGQFVFANWTRRARRLSFGVVMGLGAAASMSLSIPIGPVFFDLRLSLMALAGFFGGPPAALMAALLAVAYRTYLGGSATLVADIGIAASALLGVAVAAATRGRTMDLVRGAALTIAVGCLSIALSVILRGGLAGLSPLSVAVALLNVTATALCAFFIMRNQAVERERDLFRAAFLQSPDYNYVKTVEGKFAAVNLAVCRLHGLASPQEMVGKSDFDLETPERARLLMAGEQAVTRHGARIENLEEMVVDRHGRESWYLTSKVPLRDADGVIIGLGGVTREITAEKRLRQDVADSRNQMDFVLSGIVDGIAMYDKNNVLAYCNDQYRAFFPLTGSLRVPGATIRDILAAVAASGEQEGTPTGDLEAWIKQKIATLKVVGEQEVELTDGRWLAIRTRPSGDGAALLVVSDVTEIKAAQAALRSTTEQLKLLATTDGLTGLTNRRALDQALDREVARHRRSRTPLSILMIDVDHFKAFNDAYGHQAGDDVLQRLSVCLKGALRRPSDIAARYGGEEFLVILPGTDADGAAFIADALRDSLRTLAIPNDGTKTGRVTVSIGVAVIDQSHPDMTAAELIRHADEALYRAKDAGRDCVVTWHQDDDLEPRRRVGG